MYIPDVPDVETVIVVDGAERVGVVAESNTVGILELLVMIGARVEIDLTGVDETRDVNAERVGPRQAGYHFTGLLSIDVYGSVGTADEQVVEVGVETVGAFGVQLDDGTQRA